MTANSKSIISYIKKFLKTDFDPLVYALSIIGLGIAIALNYIYDFEDGVLDKYQKQEIYFFYSFLYYSIPYYFVIGLYFIFNRGVKHWNQASFWRATLFFFLLLALENYFYWGYSNITRDLGRSHFYFYHKLYAALKTIIIYTAGLVVYYLWADKQHSHWYGLTNLRFNWRPYALMLLAMVPLIAIAANQEDFLASYPRLKMRYFGDVNYWKYFSMYEPLYLLGFIMVEWVFRGFLVIGMVRYLGHRAVLPAAVVYCTYHFGKPMGECISSFFGGYLLGVFAYYSHTIWGGIIVHMGIALLMDLAAVLVFFQL